MIKIWKAPLVNDFFAMIYFGLLKKSMIGLFGETTNIHNDLLIGDQTIITIRPAELIAGMVTKIYQSGDLLSLFKNNEPKTILSRLSTRQEYAALNNDFEEARRLNKQTYDVHKWLYIEV